MKTLFIHSIAIVLFISTAIFSSAQAKVSAEETLAIVGATLVDPEKETERLGSVLVKDGKIVKIIRGSSGPLNADQVFYAQGLWLIPGLADMHIHNFGDNTPPAHAYEENYHEFSTQEDMAFRYLQAGITTYLDLFSSSKYGDTPEKTFGSDHFELREKQQKQSLLAPHIYLSGPLFVAKGGHGVYGFPDALSFEVTDESGKLLSEKELKNVARSVAKKVQNLIDQANPDVVKFIYDTHKDAPTDRPTVLPLTIAQTIIETAHKNSVKAIAHVGSWEAVEALAKLGVDAVTHLPHDAAPASTLKALRKQNVAVITTMSIYSDFGHMEDAAFAKDFISYPLAQVSPVSFLNTYLDFSAYSDEDKGWVRWGDQHNQRETQKKSFRSLMDAKILILSGSDSGNSGTMHGYSLHRELMKMVEFGATPWQALRTSTINSRKFLNGNSGTLRIGSSADLVLLSESPIESIANTQKIKTVFIQGQEVKK